MHAEPYQRSHLFTVAYALSIRHGCIHWYGGIDK